MFGRGEGGKGLGKGGVTERFSEHSSNHQARHSAPAQEGRCQVSGLIYENSRGDLKVFLENEISFTYPESEVACVHISRKCLAA